MLCFFTIQFSGVGHRLESQPSTTLHPHLLLSTDVDNKGHIAESGNKIPSVAVAGLGFRSFSCWRQAGQILTHGPDCYFPPLPPPHPIHSLNSYSPSLRIRVQYCICPIPGFLSSQSSPVGTHERQGTDSHSGRS